jgi:hypothetical protein
MSDDEDADHRSARHGSGIANPEPSRLDGPGLHIANHHVDILGGNKCAKLVVQSV